MDCDVDYGFGMEPVGDRPDRHVEDSEDPEDDAMSYSEYISVNDKEEEDDSNDDNGEEDEDDDDDEKKNRE